MRILSGIRPSGRLHIGNYLGMIRPVVDSQSRGQLFCLIANLHSLRSQFDKEQIQENTREALIDLLALGIDPERSTLWVQSDVPEVTELMWYLNNVTTMEMLQQCNTYKDILNLNYSVTNGIFSYPVLLASDILLYGSDKVLGGSEVIQHIEVTREIAIRFNYIYGETFKLPESEIINEFAVIPGIDGRKMSKSYKNTIYIFSDEKTLREQILSITPEQLSVNGLEYPENNLVYTLYRLFAGLVKTAEVKSKLQNVDFNSEEARTELFELLWDYFKPFRAKRESIIKDPSMIDDVRRKGAEKARAIAVPTIEKIRKLIGVIHD
jgi:tryptophanyl-tRNA synthetase